MTLPFQSVRLGPTLSKTFHDNAENNITPAKCNNQNKNCGNPDQSLSDFAHRMLNGLFLEKSYFNFREGHRFNRANRPNNISSLFNFLFLFGMLMQKFVPKPIAFLIRMQYQYIKSSSRTNSSVVYAMYFLSFIIHASIYINASYWKT